MRSRIYPSLTMGLQTRVLRGGLLRRLGALYCHLEASRLENCVQGGETAIPVRGECPIEAFAWHTRIFRDLGHPLRLGHGSERGEVDARIAIFHGGVEILGSKFRVRAQFFDEPLAMRHGQCFDRCSSFRRLAYSCHSSTAFLISESCLRLSPPQSRTITVRPSRPK